MDMQNNPAGYNTEPANKPFFGSSLEEDNVRLNVEIVDLKKKIEEKDVLAERLKSLLMIKEKIIAQKDDELVNLKNTPQSTDSPAAANAGGTINEQAVRNAIAACKAALITKNNEIDSLKSELNKLKPLVVALTEENKKIKSADASAPRRASGPDMGLIEKIYLRAFESARDIVNDAGSGVNDMTDKVFLELNNSVGRVAELQKSIIDSKNSFTDFINQGMACIRELETIISSMSNISIDVSGQMQSLAQSKTRIMADINAATGAFESGLEGEIWGSADNKTDNAPPAGDTAAMESDTSAPPAGADSAINSEPFDIQKILSQAGADTQF